MTTPAFTSAQMFIKSAEYLSTVQLCWDQRCFHQQKMLMKQFLFLQRVDPGPPPGRLTLEDLSDWLVSQRKLIPQRLTVATSEAGINLTDLTLWVNINLMMRLMELQASAEFKDDKPYQNNQNLNSRKLSYLADEIKAEVTNSLKIISHAATSPPCSIMCCSADVLVDLVPRLLLSLTNQRAQSPWQDRSFVVLSDVAVTMVLEVLDKLPYTLNSPASTVQYFRASGIYMVRTIRSRINKLSIKELNTSWSPALISSMTEAVTAQVQKLFEKPPDFILAQTVFGLSKNRAKAQKAGALPEHPKELVLHRENIWAIIGLAVIQIDNGKMESHIDLQNWPIIAEVQNKLALHNLKVSKKAEKINWHLNAQDILDVASEIHHHIYSLFGTKLNMRMALSARVHSMTRAMAHIVVQKILTLRDTLHYQHEDDEDASGDILQSILSVFLQKLMRAHGRLTGGRLNPECLHVAELVSLQVRSIAHRARRTSMLFEMLEELQNIGGVGPMADLLLVDYMSRRVSPEAFSLEAFIDDPEKGLLVADILAHNLLDHVLPELSHARTHFKQNHTAESGERARADKGQKEKTATLVDEEATQTDTSQETFGVGRAAAELQLADVAVVIKRSWIFRFFRSFF